MEYGRPRGQFKRLYRLGCGSSPFVIAGARACTLVSNGKLVWMGKTWSFVERRIPCPTALVPQPGNCLFALNAKSRLILKIMVLGGRSTLGALAVSAIMIGCFTTGGARLGLCFSDPGCLPSG